MAAAASSHPKGFTSLVSDPHVQTDSDSNSPSHRDDIGFRSGHSDTHAWQEVLIEHPLISDHATVEETLSTHNLSHLDQIYLSGFVSSPAEIYTLS